MTLIAVDKKFFDHVYEPQRKKLQKQLGLGNLSQGNFTRMIKGFKIIPVKIETPKKKGRKRNNAFII